MIAILTGRPGTGKTTGLGRAFPDGGFGILQPVLNGRRHVVDLATGETRLLEAAPDAPEHDCVLVGRFTFSADVLSWARACVDRALREAPPQAYVVVDEVGPLEVCGRGLASAVRAVVHETARAGGPSGLLIVREGLVRDVVRVFGITGAATVHLGGRLPDGRLIPAPCVGAVPP